MNIVIPYRREPYNGLELKMAIRSIEANLSGYDSIYVIGSDFPDWLRESYTIYCDEWPVKRPVNILKKLCTAYRTVGEFIQWQDDIYLMSKKNESEIVNYFHGTLADRMKEYSGGYHQMILNTALKLSEEARYYDTHTPYVVGSNILKLFDDYDWDQRNYLIKTLYVIRYGNGRPAAEKKDIKINKPMNYEQLKEFIAGAEYFSSGPWCINEDMRRLLYELFPAKSKCEK